MAAILIVVAGLLSTVARYLFDLHIDTKRADSFYIEFGASVINTLSIVWILIVLAMNRGKSEQDYGKSLRNEESTILLMVFTSGAYSMLSLFKFFVASGS